MIEKKYKKRACYIGKGGNIVCDVTKDIK